MLSGKVAVNGSLAYASQEPWIFSGSLRENILFGVPYDCAWYNTVVEACALEKASFIYKLPIIILTTCPLTPVLVHVGY